MATEQHKPSTLDAHKLEFEEHSPDMRISDFALRKLRKQDKKAKRGPNLLRQIYEVYGEVIFA